MNTWAILQALGSWFTGVVALGLGLYTHWLQRKYRHDLEAREAKSKRERAELLRHQLRIQLWEIERFLGSPGSGVMSQFGPRERQAVEELKALWEGTDLLEPKERDALSILIKGFVAGRVEGADGVHWSIRQDLQDFIRTKFQKASEDLGVPAGASLTAKYIMEHVEKELREGRGIKSL